MISSKIPVVMAICALVIIQQNGRRQLTKTKANHDEGKVAPEAEESIVVKSDTEDSSSNSSPSLTFKFLMSDSPRSSFESIMTLTRTITFGYKTGDDLDNYLENEIAHEDVDKFGVYDKAAYQHQQLSLATAL